MTNAKLLLKQTLSRSHWDKLSAIYHTKIAKYSTKSYAQEGEDMILKRIFYFKMTGLFVDVGAHHPYRFSNTYFFYKRGWRGINIDAMPDSMRLFNKLRPNDINLECPISNEEKEITYYMFNDPALNGFSKNLSDKRNQTEKFSIVGEVQLKTSRLDKILDQHLTKDQEIDFLSIDVEGLDFEVLLSTDLNKYRPKVILIEMKNFDLEMLAKDKIYVYLSKFNYKLFAKTVNTCFFLENDFLNKNFQNY